MTQYDLGVGVTGPVTYSVSCTNGQSGSGSVNFDVLPPPTNPSGVCAGNGLTAALSWTPPGGYAQDYYLRAYDNNIFDGVFNCSGPGEICLNGNGSTYSLPTIPGHSFAWWVHTRDAITTNWSDSRGGSFACPVNQPPLVTVPDSSFTLTAAIDYGSSVGSNAIDSNGDPMTYQWTYDSVVSGTAPWFTAPTSTSTLYGTLRAPGVYVVRLTATDSGGLTGFDTGQVTAWGADLVSQVPTFSAGPYTQNTPITLNSSVQNAGNLITASGFSDNFTYQWNGTGGAWNAFAGNTVAKAALGAGASSVDSVTFTPGQSGTLYIQHCVDSTNAIYEGFKETPNCTVSAGIAVAALNSPIGNFDAADCSNISGWTCD